MKEECVGGRIGRHAVQGNHGDGPVAIGIAFKHHLGRRAGLRTQSRKEKMRVEDPNLDLSSSLELFSLDDTLELNGRPHVRMCGTWVRVIVPFLYPPPDAEQYALKQKSVRGNFEQSCTKTILDTALGDRRTCACLGVLHTCESMLGVHRFVR